MLGRRVEVLAAAPLRLAELAQHARQLVRPRAARAARGAGSRRPGPGAPWRSDRARPRRAAGAPPRASAGRLGGQQVRREHFRRAGPRRAAARRRGRAAAPRSASVISSSTHVRTIVCANASGRPGRGTPRPRAPRRRARRPRRRRARRRAAARRGRRGSRPPARRPSPPGGSRPSRTSTEAVSARELEPLDVGGGRGSGASELLEQERVAAGRPLGGRDERRRGRRARPRRRATPRSPPRSAAPGRTTSRAATASSSSSGVGRARADRDDDRDRLPFEPRREVQQRAQARPGRPTARRRRRSRTGWKRGWPSQCRPCRIENGASTAAGAAAVEPDARARPARRRREQLRPPVGRRAQQLALEELADDAERERLLELARARGEHRHAAFARRAAGGFEHGGAADAGRPFDQHERRLRGRARGRSAVAQPRALPSRSIAARS